MAHSGKFSTRFGDFFGDKHQCCTRPPVKPTTRGTVLGALLLFLSTHVVLAQDRQKHVGLWIGFGLGGGAEVAAASVIPVEGKSGKAFYVRFGATPSQRLLVGFEGIYWGSDDLVDRGNSSIIAQYFPSRSGGLFVKGGLGLSTVKLRRTTQWGLGTTLGSGIDIRLKDNLYFTPNVDLLLLIFDADDVRAATPTAEIRNTNALLLFTVGLTWH